MAISPATSTIAAQAFRFMELSAISSFADDSPQAAAAAEQYEPALLTCLEYYDWSFARRLVNLAELPSLPDGLAEDADLPSIYELPGDCVMPRMILPEATIWRLDERLVRADRAGGLQLRYTRKITNEKLLPATFQTAVSAQLALLLAPQFAKTRTKRADLRADAKEYLDTAKHHDRRRASTARSDGGSRQGDWAAEATR